MLYILKIGDYLKVLTDKKVKDFVAINYIEYFKFRGKRLYSKLNEEQNLLKVAESLYIFLTTAIKVENMWRLCSQILLITVNIVIILRSCIFLIKKYNWLTLKQPFKKTKRIFKWIEKVQTILVLDYKKRNYCKIFHSSAKLIVSNLDIDETFISMYQSIMIMEIVK